MWLISNEIATFRLSSELAMTIPAYVIARSMDDEAISYKVNWSTR